MLKPNYITININSDGKRVDIINTENKKTLWSIERLNDAVEVEDKLYKLLEIFANGEKKVEIKFPAIGNLSNFDFNDKPISDREIEDAEY